VSALNALPATLTVKNNGDAGTDCLRERIGFASAGDTIVFASNVVGTIALTNGELVLAKNLTIAGPGAKVLMVSGNNSGHVFDVTGGVSCVISGLTVTGGSNGGIRNRNGATLTLLNTVLSGNFIGIINDGPLGNLTVNSCAITGNSGTTGAGVFNNAGVAQLVDSTIASNHITSGTGAGGVWNDGTMNITSCTISANTGNVTGGLGGASTVVLRNTIVAGNTGSSTPDVNGSFSSGGYNLVGKSDGSAGLSNGMNHDQVGTVAAALDAKLGRLQDNGGSTPTMALLANSPAIDMGTSAGLTVDQRGEPRRFDFPSINNAADGTDIGAFELALPRLSLQRMSSSVVLSWPGYDSSFVVESKASLSGMESWMAASGTPTVISNRLTLIVPGDAPQRFYRLRSP